MKADWTRELGRFVDMSDAVRELVRASHVVEVTVREDGSHRVPEEVTRRLTQAREAEAGVDNQIALTATDMPHVATGERVDVELGQERDTVREALPAKPALGDR